ncbi:MAG: sigma-70 family RNA polymerase sigma factor [Myxococcota bacterium]
MAAPPDLRAFERTYRAEGPYVAGVLDRLAVPREAVHDAVQDVFVAAYRRWPDFDRSRPVRPWLTAFAHRVAFRYRRSAARRHRKRAALRHTSIDRARPPTDALDARDFLGRFLAQLEPGFRDAFVLAELQGWSANEIADELSISAQAVYGRVRTVRKQLKQALVDDEAPPARAAGLVPPWTVMLERLSSGSVVTLGTSLSTLGTFVATLAVGTVGLIGVGVATRPEAAVAADPSPASAVEPVTQGPKSAPASAAPVAPERAVEAPTSAPTVEPPRGPRATSKPTAAPAPAEDPLAQETALLREAKAARTSGELQRALDLLDEHAKRFPAGQLADGRRRARIRVLCDLGRTAQARGEAAALARTRPDDPLARQSLSICAASIQNSARAEKERAEP